MLSENTQAVEKWSSLGNFWGGLQGPEMERHTDVAENFYAGIVGK